MFRSFILFPVDWRQKFRNIYWRNVRHTSISFTQTYKDTCICIHINICIKAHKHAIMMLLKYTIQIKICQMKCWIPVTYWATCPSNAHDKKIDSISVASWTMSQFYFIPALSFVLQFYIIILNRYLQTNWEVNLHKMISYQIYDKKFKKNYIDEYMHLSVENLFIHEKWKRWRNKGTLKSFCNRTIFLR